MKSNRGVSLVTLIIYILLVIIVVGILSNISKYFYMNTNYITDMGKYVSEYNKFNMYFIKDVKNNKIAYSTDTNEVIFEDGTVYSYQSNGIYRNKVKICQNIEFCNFTVSNVESGNITKNIVEVQMVLGGTNNLSLNTNYVLKYW